MTDSHENFRYYAEICGKYALTGEGKENFGVSTDLIELRLNDISDRIKKSRERADLTLVQLGEKSGVAPSTIQKIENRQMTPSIAIVLKIAAGLDIEVTDLIAPANPSRLDAILQRAGQHARIVVAQDLVFEKLAADFADAVVECWRIHIGPQQETRLNPPQKLDEQIFVCEEGEIELNLDHQNYVLRAGDSLHFQSKTVYSVRNPRKTPARYFFTGRFPHGLRPDVVSSMKSVQDSPVA